MAEVTNERAEVEAEEKSEIELEDRAVPPATIDSVPQGSNADPTAPLPETALRRPRNYSFLHKNPEQFDEVQCDGKTHSIPAHMGSTYWAILRVAYERADKPIYESQLPMLVEELMMEHDMDAWDAYKTKKQTTVYHKGEKRRAVQPAKPWQERVINNAKTLTRKGGNSPYGKRLHERGHALVYGCDEQGKPHFTLKTKAEDADE